MSRGRIALSYAGVHEIFQLALAAHEMGELDALHCSAVDLPGKWGRHLAGRVAAPSIRPLGWDALPPERVREFPWPLFCHRLVQKLLPRRKTVHLHMNDWFDRVIAHRLERSHARVFVGAETCSLHSLRVARKKGMRTVLDCPGIPSPFLDEVEMRAGLDLGYAVKQSANSAEMLERKKKEMELADLMLACSDFQKQALVKLGADDSKITVIPLWVESAFWQTESTPRRGYEPPLRVLYAGAVNLKKGVPYLLQAVKSLGSEASLTLVGSASPEAGDSFLKGNDFRHLPYLPKTGLRRLFNEHDVLVMPSLGDSFGFVALEAMAAGMPVIVSEHCGVPVPDASWRVPVCDAKSIAKRLSSYIQAPQRLKADGATAKSFAKDFEPARYRREVRNVLSHLLSKQDEPI